MNSRLFYEQYWLIPEDALPEKDPTINERLRLLLKTLNAVDSYGKFVLDAGCGTGYFGGKLREKGFTVVGMDISFKAIKRASELYPKVHFIINSLDDIFPFKDEEFDIIFSNETIEHVYGTYKMFSEMNRVLKRGGHLILTTPYHGRVKNLLIALFRFDKHFNNIEGGHIRFFTDNFLIKVFNNFGFNVIEARHIGRIRPIAKSVYIVGRKIR